MAEKIYIDRKLANGLVYRCKSNEYSTVYDEQYDSGRWESYHFIVIKRASDGKLFGANYARGLTEYQEREPFEEDDVDKDGKIEFVECKEKPVTRIEYVFVDDD